MQTARKGMNNMLDARLVKNIESLGIVEYGLYPQELASMIKDKEEARELVIALNNADTDGVLFKLLNKEEVFFEGTKYLASALGGAKVTLIIPSYLESKEEIEEKAKKHGVAVESGIVNRRKYAKDLFVHLVTVYELGKALRDEKEEGILVSVDGGDLKRYSGSTTLRELVGKVKGVRTSYVIRNASELDLTLDEAGLTNGVIESIKEETCVVSLVADKLLADRRQSCGKCVFCREGLLQLEAMTKDMTIGRGKLEYIDLSFEIGEAMVYSTPCSMGQNSSPLLLSALKAFPGEFEAHIKNKKCPANYCKAFRKIYIDPLTCDGCAKCMSVCPTDSIDGAEGYIHIVFDNTCTKCEKCIGVCPKGSIHVTTDALPRLPNKMMRVGRFKKI